MLTVGLIAFSLFNYVGDPINNMVGQDTTLEDREKLRETLGLNDPFIVQYGRYLLARGPGRTSASPTAIGGRSGC